MTHINTGNGPNFRSVPDEGAQRIYYEQHTTICPIGGLRVIYPAVGLILSGMGQEGSDTTVDVLRMDHLHSPTSLLFAPTVAEMRSLGEALIAAADAHEEKAADQLAAALAKRGGQG